MTNSPADQCCHAGSGALDAALDRRADLIKEQPLSNDWLASREATPPWAVLQGSEVLLISLSELLGGVRRASRPPCANRPAPAEVRRGPP